MQPTVKIDVSEATGVWETDGLPMVYVPRHFMLNIHNAVEDALGLSAYKSVLYDAGARAAYHWCKTQAENQNLDGVRVFEHYLERLTARGWGQFQIVDIDPGASATITVKNSIYVLGGRPGPGHPVCYMFEGFFAGGFKYASQHPGSAPGEMDCKEVECEAMGFDRCKFELKTIPQ
ncbi:MAG: DUF5943 domain-containing protein [Shinella sp.]|nr:DUF5943 domain-containing protein [Shinella sp.]